MYLMPLKGLYFSPYMSSRFTFSPDEGETNIENLLDLCVTGTEQIPGLTIWLDGLMVEGSSRDVSTKTSTEISTRDS